MAPKKKVTKKAANKKVVGNLVANVVVVHKRQIIQLVPINTKVGELAQDKVLALCNDGTIWNMGQKDWELYYPTIPQTHLATLEALKESKTIRETPTDDRVVE